MYTIRKRIVSLAIISFLFALTIPSFGNCDEWVFIGETKDGRFNSYYNNKNISFSNDKSIKIWIKQTYSKKTLDEIDMKYQKEPFCDNLKTNEDLFLYIFDYYNNTAQIIEYVNRHSKGTKHREIMRDKSNIIPGKDEDAMLDRILKDYNIKR